MLYWEIQHSVGRKQDFFNLKPSWLYEYTNLPKYNIMSAGTLTL
jgi:hypothetical protein